MSSRKTESLLGLPQVSPDFGFNGRGDMVSINEGRFSLSDRRRILDESQRQGMAIEATAAKAQRAMSKIAKINQQAAATFDETATYIMKAKEQVEETDAQEFIEAYAHYLTQALAQETIGISKVSAAVIAKEVARSPYPPEEEKEGFLKRLFG